MLTVICEDNDEMKNKIEKILIREIEVFEEEIEVKLNFNNISFSGYCNALKAVISNHIMKIYIIDIDLLGEKDGITIATQIRETDRYSKIIIIATQTDMVDNIFSQALEISDFIFKNNNFENRLKNTVKKILEIIYKDDYNGKLKIKSGTYEKIILFDEILYVENIKRTRDVILHTIHDGELWFQSTISEIPEKFGEKFIKTKSNCVVNMNHIDKITMGRKPVIYLTNGEKVIYISKAGKKRLKEYGY